MTRPSFMAITVPAWRAAEARSCRTMTTVRPAAASGARGACGSRATCRAA
ncbi:hypothetical protein SAZ_38930 [Streptomyces noursei ZPM]|nr:hypothetical protein SAZ_38930 [Streptomyces noursei ZPM]EPY92962.1 hypothetical protein K530_50500 [Streptomyces noursei CCRC 11814]